VDWLKIVQAGAIVILGIWAGYKEFIEWRVKKAIKLTAGIDIGPNPERCADHEKRLRQMESDIGQIRTDIAVIKSHIKIT
jgi:hypothetical protein